MKNALLIGGGGTLGRYTAQELVANGCRVDVIGLGENPFCDDTVRYCKMEATLENLTEYLQGKHYDGLVDFIWYRRAEEYPAFHRVIAAHTEHHIFLSSYRVYADLQHPITEDAPQLADVVTDDSEFLEKEDYAVSKSKCEKYLKQSGLDNWTIVRPVISTSLYRFDLVCYSGQLVREAAKEGRVLKLPASSRYKTAGVDWAGNTGKLIARLLLNPDTRLKAYTVSSAENLTWNTVAEYYEQLIGLKVEWVEDEAYVREVRTIHGRDWIFRYDRAFDRAVDNRAVLAAAGVKQEDLLPLREGIALELARLNEC